LKSFMPHERDRAHAYANELNLQRERELDGAFGD